MVILISMVFSAGCISTGKHTVTKDGAGNCQEQYNGYFLNFMGMPSRPPSCNKCSTQVPRYIAPQAQYYPPAPQQMPQSVPQAPCPCQRHPAPPPAPSVATPQGANYTVANGMHVQPVAYNGSLRQAQPGAKVYYMNGQFVTMEWNGYSYEYVPYHGPIVR